MTSSEQDVENTPHPATGWDVIHFVVTKVLPVVMLVVAYMVFAEVMV